VDFLGPEETQSKEALRFAYAYEQGYDNSCGYSAAASILSLYWNIQVGERELIERYAGAKPESARLDVTFKDLAGIFADYGFSVKGLRMSWEQLETALARFAPVIVHYDYPDRHFALAIRAKDGWIITLDPASGSELLRRDQFVRRWSGAVLLASSSSSKRNEALLGEAIRVQEDRQELLVRLGR
jgi:uncharacterized protein